MSRRKSETVDEYIASYPPDVQEILTKLRAIVRRMAPEVQESISYGIPTFKLNGKVLIYFAAFKNHIGLYPPAPKKFNRETSRYANPRGNLRFPLDEAFPFDLVGRITEHRKKEIMPDVGG